MENHGSQKIRCLRIPDRSLGGQSQYDQKLGFLPDGNHQRSLQDPDILTSMVVESLFFLNELQFIYIFKNFRPSTTKTEAQDWA